MQKAVENLVKELNQETMSRSGKDKDKKMARIEAGLARARSWIKDAINKSRDSLPLTEDLDYVPHGEIYRNAYVFQRSYMLMESMLKIYVYEEGDPPLFHYGPSKDIYSTEGIFLGLIESSTHFRTYDPDEAHLYFLPFSVVMILQNLFDPVIRDKAVLERVVQDYVRIVSTKYSYWNRSLGADHFMLSCHDWVRHCSSNTGKTKDDVKVFDKMPERSSLSYKEMMEQSKYCLCPSGYEVASPRIVEAIYAECVPVLISEDYVLPFSDVLDWDKFSVRVSVRELPELKRILLRIGDDGYKLLHERVKQVQRHFVVNDPPKRYDVFHMMIHSLWLRRLNLRINA
ncbi:hypothetical protein DH2020_024987 [Rehmannia glutinosa]|uniref:Exostosin GT47 domain-containing protein n=1 Tax=Rehmannia glutinosa TaxID=99300 RepID=A0ABR0W3R0_REHGL